MQIGFSLSLHFVQILIIFSQTSQSKRIVAEVNGVLGYIHDVDEIITKVQSDIDQLDKDSGEFDNATMRENLLKVLQHFKIISIQVEQIEKQYTNITIQQFLYTEIFDNYNDEEDLGNLRHEINNINDNFKEMLTIENSNNSNTFIISFAELIDRRRNGKCITPNDFYLELFDLWFRSKKILTKMRHEYQIHVYSFCYSPQSPQQIVFSIYKHIGLTELKAYILIEYSLLLRRIDGQRDLMEETNKVRAKYKNMIENSLNLLEETMQKADRDMWRCDPHELHYNVTYDEVTRLLQGFIVNEVDLNSDGSCSESCSDYQNTTTKGCFKQKFCSQQPKCEGRIHDCQLVDSYLSVCQSQESSNRRYEYIEYEQDDEVFTLGEYEKCFRGVNNVASWNRWIFTKCSYCICLCNEPGPKSDRYFSLLYTLSDIKANKVVTGVRFVKKNRIFHLQIQQGQLLPRGVINESTVEWVPIEDDEVTAANVHTMSYQERGIDLDDVLNKDEKTSVVTGLRFRVLNGRLNLAVLFSPLDFERGKLFPHRSFRYYKPPHNESRQKLNLDNLDVPTRLEYMDMIPPTSKNNQYLEFVNSGIEQDAAQTTIPFIDIQDVVSNPPVPLAGIGIYYRSLPGYGGFVAPKIITYDISQHVRMPTW